MHLKPSLTKENFFNEMTEKYPNAMKAFGDWIDQYKKAAEWDMVFKTDLYDSRFAKAPKFHDLPYEMQMGIWIEYMRQRDCRLSIENMFAYDLRKGIENFFQYYGEVDAYEEKLKELNKKN